MAEVKNIRATIGALKKGSYLLIDNVACAVLDSKEAKTGGRGSARLRIEAASLIDGQKKIVLINSGDPVQVPIVEKRTAQVLSIQNEAVSVMDMESYETFDLKIPGELVDKIPEGGQVIYWEIMDQKILKSVK